MACTAFFLCDKTTDFDMSCCSQCTVLKHMDNTTSSISLGQTELLVFYNEIKPVAHKWKDIGLQIGMKTNDLKEIKKDCDDTKECFQEMLDRWLRNSTNNPVENWRTICNALLKSGENGLAKEVAQKHGMYLPILGLQLEAL